MAKEIDNYVGKGTSIYPRLEESTKWVCGSKVCCTQSKGGEVDRKVMRWADLVKMKVKVKSGYKK